MVPVLCHARDDLAAMRQVVTWLGACDVPVETWVLEPDESLLARLEHAATPPCHVLVALSPQSIGTRWVRQEVVSGALVEWAQARSMDEDAVVVFLHKPCEIPLWLRGRVYANFVNKPFEAACDELHQVLTGQSRQERAATRSKIENRVFRTWQIDPVGGRGRHALVMEFGVSMTRVQGLHVEVDLGANYVHSQDWFGPPNLPRIPSRPGGPFFDSSLRRQPPIYTRRFRAPEITPQQSYYLYVEANEPLVVRRRMFLDSHGREV